MSKKSAIQLVFEEVERATGKFGAMRSSHEGYAILKEEVDELWAEVKANAPLSRMQEEAVQVAAMAVRFLMDICGLEAYGSGGRLDDEVAVV